MTKITHAKRVAEIKQDIIAQHVETYRAMIRQAEDHQSRGDTALAKQARRQAAEYADTRLGAAGRRIAGIDGR